MPDILNIYLVFADLDDYQGDPNPNPHPHPDPPPGKL